MSSPEPELTRGPAGKRPRQGILGPDHRAMTAGMFSLIAFVAFEALAVTTVMPTVARDLDGVDLFAVAFAAPLASGVVGMALTGSWSDRRGPALPLAVATALFGLGLVVCGLAPTMQVLVAGRVLQGLGGGALIVGLYVVVGLVYPALLRPAVFASFAAAWVLPSLFGPALAAWLAHAFGWRSVFLVAVGFVAVASLPIWPRLRSLPPVGAERPVAGRRTTLVWWSVVAAVGVLAVELAGSRTDLWAIAAVAGLAALVLALLRLLPPGTLLTRRGLPSVIASRGAFAAGFFAAEAYLPFVLQERWDYTPGQAGIALTIVGLMWAGASQAQSRLGERVGDRRAMMIAAGILSSGAVPLLVTVSGTVSPVLAIAAYAVMGAGMGFGYPRTGVAMLAASTDADRGFNSSALTIADSLGGAVALSAAGVAFATAQRWGTDPFTAVYAVAAGFAVITLWTSARAC